MATLNNLTIRPRRDTAANWATVNPVLKEGEIAIEKDTKKTKIGDGSTAWNNLPYAWVVYVAGDGIIFDGTTIKVKAGTNVTVDSNGVNVEGGGSVADDDAGLISGGTLFDEVRIASNGNYVLAANTARQNISALDTQAKSNADAIGSLSADGNFIKKSTTKNVSENLSLLDTALKTFEDQTGLDLEDLQDALRTILIFARWNKWDIDDIKQWIQNHYVIESGTVSLTNSEAFPFNNSQTSVSLSQTRNPASYIVLTEVTTFSGNVGEVVISDRLSNGFKIAYTGSASGATIKYTVVGGFES